MKKFTNPSMSTSQKQMSFHKVNKVFFNSLSDLTNSSFVVTFLCIEYCRVEVELFLKAIFLIQDASLLLSLSFCDVRFLLIRKWEIG